MNHYYFYETLVLISTLLPVLVGWKKYNILDAASKIFFVLLVISLVTECIAFWAAVTKGNNLWVYNISNVIQAFFIACYFNECIDILKKKNIGIYIGTGSILLGLLNMIFLQPVIIYNSNYFLFETILIVLLGIILYMQLIFSPVYLKIYRSPHFWFTLILMVFYVFNFINLSLYDYFTLHLKQDKAVIDIAISIFNDFANVGFALVFLLYPKMRSKHA